MQDVSWTYYNVLMRLKNLLRDFWPLLLLFYSFVLKVHQIKFQHFTNTHVVMTCVMYVLHASEHSKPIYRLICVSFLWSTILNLLYPLCQPSSTLQCTDGLHRLHCIVLVGVKLLQTNESMLNILL